MVTKRKNWKRAKASQDSRAARAFERSEEERIREMRAQRVNPIREEEKKKREVAAKLRAQEKREKVASQRAEEMLKPGYVAPKRGRPFGTTGGYWKPWMKRVIGKCYTDYDLLRDLILLSPKDRLTFLTELDPKSIGEGSPEEIAAKIKAALAAIQKSVPAK